MCVSWARDPDRWCPVPLIDRQFRAPAIEQEAALVRPASGVSPACPRRTHTHTHKLLLFCSIISPSEIHTSVRHTLAQSYQKMWISISDDFSSHCSIHLWDPLQICWTITVSCFLSCLTVSFHFSSVLSPSSSSSSSSSSSLHSFFLSLTRFFSVHLLNSRLLRHPPPPLSTHTPPHPLPTFPFADSQHSLPLSSALSPLYKDSHWWTWTFCPSHTLPLILLSCTPCEKETN